jgi:hypothetical protein
MQLMAEIILGAVWTPLAASWRSQTAGKGNSAKQVKEYNIVNSIFANGPPG